MAILTAFIGFALGYFVCALMVHASRADEIHDKAIRNIEKDENKPE